MSTRRGYDLVCPIARALDRVGDRWTLLILRDLHAGPARFSDLETGLGTASNLLSSRLRDLTDDGLVQRTETGAYALTSLGEHTTGLIRELSNLGLLFDRPAEPKRPGSLRTVYLPLQAILRAAPVWSELCARLVVDGESFTVRSTPSGLTVHYNDVDFTLDTVLATSYDAIMALSDGDISLDQFLNQLEIAKGPEHALSSSRCSGVGRPPYREPTNPNSVLHGLDDRARNPSADRAARDGPNRVGSSGCPRSLSSHLTGRERHHRLLPALVLLWVGQWGMDAPVVVCFGIGTRTWRAGRCARYQIRR